MSIPPIVIIEYLYIVYALRRKHIARRNGCIMTYHIIIQYRWRVAGGELQNTYCGQIKKK